MLVAELKTAQSRIQKKRAVSDAEEQMIIDQYVKSDQDLFSTQNGSSSYVMRSPSPERATPVFGRPPKSPSPDRNYINERKIQVTSPTPTNFKPVEFTFGMKGPISPEREKRSVHTESYEKRFLGERNYSSLRSSSPERSYRKPRSPERQSRPFERSSTMPKRSYSLERTYDLEAYYPRPTSPETKSPKRRDDETFRFRTTSPRPVVRSASLGGYYQHKRSHSLSEAPLTTMEKSESTYFVSGLERPAFTTQQTKYVFAVSPPKSTTAKTDGGKQPLTSYTDGAPSIPQRTSSREFMARQRTMRQEWGSHGRKQLSDANHHHDPYTLTHSSSLPARTQAPLIVDTQNYSPNYSMPSNNRETTPSSVIEESVVKMTVPKAAGKSTVATKQMLFATTKLYLCPDLQKPKLRCFV